MGKRSLEKKDFFEKFSDGVVIHHDGKILHVNSAFASLTGKKEENFTGLSFLEFFPPDQREIIQKKFIYEIKQKKFIPVHEFHLISSDSHIFPIEITATQSEYGDKPAVFCLIRNISERKKIEGALKQSENLYRTLVETHQDGLSIMDLKGKILYCNQKKVKMFGYDNPDQIIGKNGFDLLAQEERKRGTEELQKIFQQGILVNLEFTALRKDGSNFPAEFSASLLRDEKGQPVQIVDIMRDITERKKVEQAIRESERRYRESIENSPSPIFAINKKGIIQIWNAACETTFQYKKEQMISKAHYRRLWNPKDLESIQAKINKIWKGKTLNNENMTYFCKDGSIRHTVSRLYPLHDEENRIYACVFANTDITERKKMEDDLLTEHSFRSGIIKNAAEGLCVSHEIKNFPYIKFTIWNDRMTEMTGYTREEINRIGWYQSLHPDTDVQARAIDRMKDITKGNDLLDEEWEITRSDGQKRTLTISTSSLSSSDGKNHVLAIMHDITQRRQAEEKMKASLKEKEVLLQEIHHRVKNNMQIISSLLNLQSNALIDKKTIELFRESRNRIRSMALIHEKLYQSQNLAQINFGEYIETLVTHLFHTYKIDLSVIKLKTELNDVHLDINTAIPCGLIMNELVSNSLKHAFPDGKKGDIKIFLKKRTNGRVSLSIIDNGIGFAQKYNPKNPKTLGLQIVNDLVHQINGKLYFQDKRGAHFRIEF